MTELFKNKFRVQSARLPGYDYGQPGFYFVTICTELRVCYFGDIVDEKTVLNEIGKMTTKYWLEIPQHFDNVVLDEFVVMPNHIHGIIEIVENDGGCRGRCCRDEALPRLYANERHDNEHHDGERNDEHSGNCERPQYNGKHPQMSAISPKPHSLPPIIGSFKSICTKTINKSYQNINFAWQPRFYDHVIRDETAYHNIQYYIQQNPTKWWRDRNNPEGLLM